MCCANVLFCILLLTYHHLQTSSLWTGYFEVKSTQFTQDGVILCSFSMREKNPKLVTAANGLVTGEIILYVSHTPLLYPVKQEMKPIRPK